MERTYPIEERKTGAGGLSAWSTWAGAGLLGLTGLIHLVEAPEYWGEVRYIGALFVVSVIGVIAAIVGILRQERWGWQLGLLVAAALAVGYLLSRTVGIPLFREASLDKFLEPLGIASLLVNVVFVLLALRILPRLRPTLARTNR